MRELDISADLDATPEEVFDAITNAEKITSWFAPIASVTPGVGGQITLSWGEGMEGVAPIRGWEPGKRFMWAEREDSASPRFVDFQIAAREGGGSTLRLVHSGFGSEAKFDGEVESTYGGWSTFFAMLQYGIPRFTRAKAVNVFSFRMAKESKADAWQRMCSELRIGDFREGEPYTAMVGTLPIAGAVVRNVKPGYLCLSVNTFEDSLLGIFVEGGKQAMITLEWILYGATAARAAEARAAIDSLLAAVLKED